MRTRGFSIVELLIAFVVTAILATAMTRMLLTDSRFVSKQDAMMTARQTARAAMNVMAVELRMVSDSGLVAAAAESVTVRVPYAFGVSCGPSSGLTVASLMPADSLMYASATPSGIARLQANGMYEFPPGGASLTSSTDSAPCIAAGIQTVPDGWLIGIVTPPAAASAGTIFYVYQLVTYRFSASTDLPGRIGLWRRVGTTAFEEQVAPFDSTARFRFLVGPGLTLQDTPPVNLTTVRGLELKLVAESFLPPQGETAYQDFDLPLQVIFMNMAN